VLFALAISCPLDSYARAGLQKLRFRTSADKMLRAVPVIGRGESKPAEFPLQSSVDRLRVAAGRALHNKEKP
jgi:hypothetical protein